MPLLERRVSYTTGQLSILFGFAPRTIAKMIDRGILPGFTVPGSEARRVSHESLCAYICRHPEFGLNLNDIFGPDWDQPRLISKPRTKSRNLASVNHDD